ncbi:MAG: hypothetical protein C5B58_06580 [Acidobacteria bacterium]|nr:MAG: hypothetical protein C5B58_06580 [Acidobacteriota bacterium]
MVIEVRRLESTPRELIRNMSLFLREVVMSLISCPECQHDVSDRAAACPNCGLPADLMTSTTFPRNPPLLPPTPLVDTAPTRESGRPIDTAADRQPALAESTDCTTVSKPTPAAPPVQRATSRTLEQRREPKDGLFDLPVWLAGIAAVIGGIAVAYLLTPADYHEAIREFSAPSPKNALGWDVATTRNILIWVAVLISFRIGRWTGWRDCQKGKDAPLMQLLFRLITSRKAKAGSLDHLSDDGQRITNA